MPQRSTPFLLLTCVLLLPACMQREPTTPPPPASPAVAESTVDVQQWLGRWTGPEGTWLEIAAAASGYQVTLANLDGPRVFAAVPAEGGLSFERDGVREVIRPTDGPGTGMKWLVEKTTCLAVKPGEGYCRE